MQDWYLSQNVLVQLQFEHGILFGIILWYCSQSTSHERYLAYVDFECMLKLSVKLIYFYMGITWSTSLAHVFLGCNFNEFIQQLSMIV